jgi:hypothetical protein
MKVDSASLFPNYPTKNLPPRIIEIAEIQIRVLHQQYCNGSFYFFVHSLEPYTSGFLSLTSHWFETVKTADVC